MEKLWQNAYPSAGRLARLIRAGRLTFKGIDMLSPNDMTEIEKTRTRAELKVSIGYWNDKINQLIASGATRNHVNSPSSKKLREARDTVDRLYTLLDIFEVTGGDHD